MSDDAKPMNPAEMKTRIEGIEHETSISRIESSITQFVQALNKLPEGARKDQVDLANKTEQEVLKQFRLGGKKAGEEAVRRNAACLGTGLTSLEYIHTLPCMTLVPELKFELHDHNKVVARFLNAGKLETVIDGTIGGLGDKL